jgi:hypothetical protein
VRFEVLRAVLLKIQIFWDVALCRVSASPTLRCILVPASLGTSCLKETVKRNVRT